MFGYAMSTGDCDARNAELVVLMSISIRFFRRCCNSSPKLNMMFLRRYVIFDIFESRKEQYFHCLKHKIHPVL